MELLVQTVEYALENSDFFLRSLAIHLQLSGTALGISTALCVPLGIWIARRVTLAQVVINAVNTIRVIPSLAILFLAFPYLGLGFWPALVALTVLACPPILINTYAAFRGVDREVIEAARGMGMSDWQILRKVEAPLALPVLLTGVRTATVEVISSAALAAFIAAGGLGDFILRGFAVRRPHVMLVGAIPIALLALFSELFLGFLQRRLSVPGIR